MTDWKIPTELALKRHAEWKEFVEALTIVVEVNEAGAFTYYFSHPTKGEDKVERGWFSTREAALESGRAVIALKWPEPQLMP